MAPGKFANSSSLTADHNQARPAGSEKRKHVRTDSSNPSTIQSKRKRTQASAIEGREWEQQYYQGCSTRDFSGLGCGWYLLGTPRFPSQSPCTPDMRLEIMSGGGEPGSGGIRLCGTPDYWGKGCDAIFMVPFEHVGKHCGEQPHTAAGEGVPI